MDPSLNPLQKIELQKILTRNYYDSLQLKQTIILQKQQSLQRARKFFQKNTKLN